MTKQLYIYFCILFFTLNSYSQSPNGIYAVLGLYQPTLDSPDLLTGKSNLGFCAGFDYKFGYHETWDYKFEFLYNQSSFDLKTVDRSYELIEDTKYSYSSLQFGLCFNYYILKPDEDKFYLGPQVGFFGELVVGFSTPYHTDIYDNSYLPHLLKDNSSIQDLSAFNYGPRIGFTGGYNHFKFDLRYSLGLANVLSGMETDSRDEYNRYTGPVLEGTISSITFGVSYNIFH